MTKQLSKIKNKMSMKIMTIMMNNVTNIKCPYYILADPTEN